MEEKNLLALHNLTEKNLLGRQHIPNFNPRPREGGDCKCSVFHLQQYHFNPRPREGGDTNSIAYLYECLEFQSTPPARGGDSKNGKKLGEIMVFQSTPPARGATQQFVHKRSIVGISIHAPREGGDYRP